MNIKVEEMTVNEDFNRFDDKQELKRIYIFITLVVLISLGTLAGLVWNILRTGHRLEGYEVRLSAFEKDTGASGSQTGDLKTEPPETGTNASTLSPRTLDVIYISGNRMSTTILATDQAQPTSATNTPIGQTLTLMLPFTTTKTDRATATTTTTQTTISPTEIAFPTAFKVLQTNETTHRNFSFLALQVEVPSNGESASENWCRDYENLCKQFSRRPTGCGIKYISSGGYKVCSEIYNSDMNIENVLGCSPTSQVSMAVNAAMPKLSPPATSQVNAFAFLSCRPANCHNTIRLSEMSLHRMSGFWDSNMTTMYTVCR